MLVVELKHLNFTIHNAWLCMSIFSHSICNAYSWQLVNVFAIFTNLTAFNPFLIIFIMHYLY